jgi:hypothetical protein
MRVLDPKQASRCRESVRIEDYRGAEGYKDAYHSLSLEIVVDVPGRFAAMKDRPHHE